LTIFQKAFKKKALKTVLDHEKAKSKFSLKRIDPLLQNVHMGFFDSKRNSSNSFLLLTCIEDICAQIHPPNPTQKAKKKSP
jgi:hypothetical protein